MSADALEELARAIGREAASLGWCRERRLLECVVADDVERIRALLPAAVAGGGAATVNVGGRREPILTVAIGVAAWKVAAELVLRGERLVAPPESRWDAGSYAVAALDE